MIKWLKRKEKGWRDLLKDGSMNKRQFFQLSEIKNRLSREVRPRWYIKQCFAKIQENEVLDMSFSAMLLLPFWRKLGKKNRLAQLLDRMVEAVFSPAINSMKSFSHWMKTKLKKKPKVVVEEEPRKLVLDEVKIEESDTD